MKESFDGLTAATAPEQARTGLRALNGRLTQARRGRVFVLHGRTTCTLEEQQVGNDVSSNSSGGHLIAQNSKAWTYKASVTNDITQTSKGLGQELRPAGRDVSSRRDLSKAPSQLTTTFRRYVAGYSNGVFCWLSHRSSSWLSAGGEDTHAISMVPAQP